MTTRRWLILISWCLLLATLIWWNSIYLKINTDFAQFLPPSATQQDQVLLAQLRDGIAARTLLIRIGGGSIETLAKTSRALVHSLSTDQRLLQIANGGMNWAALATDELLFRYRYLIGPAANCVNQFTIPELHTALTTRLNELASGMALLDKQQITADPTACYRQLLRSLLPHQLPHTQQGVWFSPDHQYALLVVITRAAASDLTAQRAIIQQINTQFTQLTAATPELTLELAGPGYFAVSSEQTIKTETTLLSIAANIAVVFILIFAFRSIPLVLLGVLPLFTGLMLAAALVTLLFGSIHGIAFALGITLLGVALDYPIHVYTHISQMRAAHAQSFWSTFLFGVITTVFGYAAFIWTQLTGLTQLGLLAAVGLLIAALTSRYLLPQLIPAQYQLPAHRWLNRWQQLLPILSLRAGRWFLFASSAVLIAVIGSSDTIWETDIRRLSTIPAVEIMKDREMRSQLGAADVARLFYVIGESEAALLTQLEAALPALEQLKQRSVIGGFENVAQWLPSPATQLARQFAMPSRVELTSALTAANHDLPFRLERFTPFLDAIEQSKTLPPLQLADLANSVLAVRAGLLVQPFGQQWLGLIPLSDVKDAPAVAALQQLAAQQHLHYLDLRQASGALLTHFFNTTTRQLPLVALAIIAVLFIARRRWGQIEPVLLPISLTIVLTVLSLIFIHSQLNLFHLISLVLVTGLGIDYSLFCSRQINSASEQTRTVFAVTIAALSTAVMFGLLAFSALPPLNSIGVTATIGIGWAYLTAMTLARAQSVG
ncbi:MMPL family transporter [Rhodoferax sp. 4810]|uniref:MMPL family transporter n=1 Tax=Thiospirillum jenense TaxID=1653858 RepID=A0A839HI11_9GAMM|nr:MMPL family transporter [Thiospirillum jenense]MBB1075107.1 MMPL family transporter [Rhodoferax jenense]MBB1126756.1 MMPL family transporter [Thiospirillum jenense]